MGPVRQMQMNSKFYSAKCSPRIRDRTLPHITVQCPVYKEGLHSVIAPTVKSIKEAISTYELQGGSANMFINDDGLQIIDEDERRARIEFYADHSIGWTARPKHGLNGFVRKGKFKKVCSLYKVFWDSASVTHLPSLTEQRNLWEFCPLLWLRVSSISAAFGNCGAVGPRGDPINFHFSDRKWLTSHRLGLQHELRSHDLLQS